MEALYLLSYGSKVKESLGTKNKHRIAQRRPTLTGGNPQLPSAQKSLTSVFGMGTGVASLPSSLDYKVFERQVLLYQL